MRPYRTEPDPMLNRRQLKALITRINRERAVIGAASERLRLLVTDAEALCDNAEDAVEHLSAAEMALSRLV